MLADVLNARSAVPPNVCRKESVDVGHQHVSLRKLTIGICIHIGTSLILTILTCMGNVKEATSINESRPSAEDDDVVGGRR